MPETLVLGISGLVCKRESLPLCTSSRVDQIDRYNYSSNGDSVVCPCEHWSFTGRLCTLGMVGEEEHAEAKRFLVIEASVVFLPSLAAVFLSLLRGPLLCPGRPAFQARS